MSFHRRINTYVSLFQYAKGILISDNGYRYREDVPFSEYFYNTGKVLGKIHSLSKNYHPAHKPHNFFIWRLIRRTSSRQLLMALSTAATEVLLLWQETSKPWMKCRSAAIPWCPLQSFSRYLFWSRLFRKPPRPN